MGAVRRGDNGLLNHRKPCAPLAGDLVKPLANALAAQPPSIILPKPKLLCAPHAVPRGLKNRGVAGAVVAHFLPPFFDVALLGHVAIMSHGLLWGFGRRGIFRGSQRYATGRRDRIAAARNVSKPCPPGRTGGLFLGANFCHRPIHKNINTKERGRANGD